MSQKLDIIVIDDFYHNVDDVRKFALQQKFNVTGNFPGYRTQSMINDIIKEAIEYVVYPWGGKVTNWFDDKYTGAFQYTTEEHHSWIHSDGGNDWAAVLYLTPNAPLSAGTAFYRHKETNNTSVFGIDDIHKFQINNCQDFDLWEVDSEIKMQPNDVVLVRPFIWHSLEENKLVQIYHIDLDMSETEKN